MHFFYDAQNKPAMVAYNGLLYSYAYNLQGDVIALLNANGTVVVEYRYDAWGKQISKTSLMADTLGTLNPFQYRGYVYDEETGLYDIHTRFYSPTWSHFVSSDSTGIIGISKLAILTALQFVVYASQMHACFIGYFYKEHPFSHIA